MLAKRLPTILPPLTLDEALETTKIHSIVGLLAPGQALITRRPFRAPHHTASDAGLLGGNANPTPGEISLAHHGVLFLDELPEFKRSVLETMRQPVEEGRVTISRADGMMTFPSQFMLVAAMNLTTDGKMPGESRCSPREIQNYLNRISGPLLDRIDIHVEVPAVKFREITAERTGETSAQIRERVVTARRRQQERFAGKRTVTCNARMGTRELKAFCALDEATLELLKMAMNELKLSARAYDRTLKVARTIADLAGRSDSHRRISPKPSSIVLSTDSCGREGQQAARPACIGRSTHGRKIFELTPTQSAALVAAPVLLGSLARIPVGMLTDRLGGRLVFSALLAICAVPAFLVPTAGNFHQLIAVGFFLGLAGSSFAVGVGYV